MPARRWPAVRAVLVLMLVLLAAGWTPAAAEESPWTAVPAPAGKDAPRAGERSGFYLEGGPGTVFEDKVAVLNPGDRPRSLDVRGDGPWIALAARQVRVPPRTRADVPFTVTVPSGAEPGDHSGALVVSGEGRRTRVRLTLRVTGPPALPALAVEHLRVSRAGGGAVIRYALVNRGNTALSPHLTIRADGLFGTVLRRTAGDVPAALPPGRSVRLAERWPDAPRLDSVRVHVTATAPGAVRATASRSYTPLVWVLPVLGGGALLLAGAVALVVRRLRRARAGAAA
ncbi:COG1470 family protein [Streptomyces sp. NPDC002537]